MNYDEIDKYINYYFYGNNCGIIRSLNEESKYLHEYLIKATRFEAPDLFYVKEQIIYIFEHFEIDSSKHRKDGSFQRKILANVENDINKKIKDSTKNEIIFRSELDPKYNWNYYLENLKASLFKHYKKISTYKDNVLCKLNISAQNVKFVTCFIIEDTTLLGTYTNTGTLVFPNQIKEFMDEIRKLNNIDYLICSSNNGSSYITHILNKNYFEKNKSIEYQLSKVGIHPMKPKMIGYSMKI